MISAISGSVSTRDFSMSCEYRQPVFSTLWLRPSDGLHRAVTDILVRLRQSIVGSVGGHFVRCELD